MAMRSLPWTPAAASCRSRNSLVDGTTISDLLGPAEAGVRRGLRLSCATARLREIYMTKRTVTIDPVPAFGAPVLPLAGTTGVGYLHLRSYISPADPQLRDAFTFRALDCEYFIIDLRYNGGGLVEHGRTDQQPARRRPHWVATCSSV